MIELIRRRDERQRQEIPQLISFLNKGGITNVEPILQPTADLDENGKPRLKSSVKIEVSYPKAMRLKTESYIASEDEFKDALDWGVDDPNNWDRMREFRLNTALVALNLVSVNEALGSTPAQVTLFENKSI